MRQAALGALAALAGWAGAVALLEWPRRALLPPAGELLRHHLAVGAVLALLSAIGAAVAGGPQRGVERPARAVLLGAALGLAAFALAAIVSHIAVAGRPLPQCLATGVLGAGLVMTALACRLVLARPEPWPARAGVALAVAGAGAFLAFGNYAYSWNLVLGRAPDAAAHAALLLLDEDLRFVASVLLPLVLAVALPSLAAAAGWPLPGQVAAGLLGTALLQRLLDLRGPDWHLLGVPAHIELVAACLVPVACACAARRARPDGDRAG